MRPSPRALLPFLLALVTHSLGCADTAAVPDCTADMEAEVCAVFQLVNQERVDRGLAAAGRAYSPSMPNFLNFDMIWSRAPNGVTP